MLHNARLALCGFFNFGKILFMKNGASVLLLLLITVLLFSCRADESEKGETPAAEENKFQFTLTVESDHEKGSSLAALFLFDAEKGRSSEPLAYFAGENGTISGEAFTDRPHIFRIVSSWHKPFYFFLPSYSDDTFTAVIRPEPIRIKQNPAPAVTGSFNHFDRFSAVQMKKREDGIWEKEIEFESDTLIYRITGAHSQLEIHGTDGDLQIAERHSGLDSGVESKLVRSNSEPFIVRFEPGRFAADQSAPGISFGDDVPLYDRAVAAIYSETIRQLNQTEQVIEQGGKPVAEDFELFLDRIQQLAETHNHPDAPLVADLAAAVFAEFLEPEPEWADRVLGAVPPASDLWLLYYPVITELFAVSGQSERVSQYIWDIYRQNRFDAVQGEALFNLLKFHYDRNEDEEWYQAHFDLVREYPAHMRINHSYQRGYAPQSVVFVGEYFPGIPFRSAANPEEQFRPTAKEADLHFLFFWEPDRPESMAQFENLVALEDYFSEYRTEITTISLSDDSAKVNRIHKHYGTDWNAAIESFSSPTVQVSGITEAPHLIVLDSDHRIIVNSGKFLDNRDSFSELYQYLQQ